MPVTRGHNISTPPTEPLTAGACLSFSRYLLRRVHKIGGAILLLVACSLMGQQQPDIIVEIVPHGNRSVPSDVIRAHVFTRVGDIYDSAAIERDFNSLWNTGFFEDIRFEREATPKGWILHIYVKEKPRIKEINYVGINAISKSDILDRFKQDKVALSVEIGRASCRERV